MPSRLGEIQFLIGAPAPHIRAHPCNPRFLCILRIPCFPFSPSYSSPNHHSRKFLLSSFFLHPSRPRRLPFSLQPSAFSHFNLCAPGAFPSLFPLRPQRSLRESIPHPVHPVHPCSIPSIPVREAILFRRSRIKRLEGALFKIHLTSPLRGWMPTATGWSYAPTGNGGQECPPSVNSCSGTVPCVAPGRSMEAGSLSVSQRALRESFLHPVHPVHPCSISLPLSVFSVLSVVNLLPLFGLWWVLVKTERFSMKFLFQSFDFHGSFRPND